MSVHYNSKAKKDRRENMTQLQLAKREIAWRQRVQAEVDRLMTTLVAGQMLVYPLGDRYLFDAVVKAILATCRKQGRKVEYQINSDRFIVVPASKVRAA